MWRIICELLGHVPIERNYPGQWPLQCARCRRPLLTMTEHDNA